jgi:hypothetical protein
MEQPPAPSAQNQEQHRRRAGGRPWPKGVSGNPSGLRVSKRATALFESMAADFGGADALSAIDRAMLWQACRLMVRGDRTQDADIAIRLSNASARLLTSVRNGKRPKRADESNNLAAYLKAQYGARDDAEPDAAAGSAPSPCARPWAICDAFVDQLVGTESVR